MNTEESGCLGGLWLRHPLPLFLLRLPALLPTQQLFSQVIPGTAKAWGMNTEESGCLGGLWLRHLLPLFLLRLLQALFPTQQLFGQVVSGTAKAWGTKTEESGCLGDLRQLRRILRLLLFLLHPRALLPHPPPRGRLLPTRHGPSIK